MNTCIALGCLKAYLKWSAGWCNTNIVQKGKTALVAGASKQPGYQIAANLANRGCRVIVIDNVNLAYTRDKLIAETGNKLIEYRHVDFYQLNSVRKLAQDIKRGEDQLHMLIYADNVSGMDGKLTDDGFNKVVQYNNLAPFLLTYELTDLMKKTPNSRIIFRSNILAYMHKITSPLDINRSPSSPIPLMSDFYEYCNSSALTLMTMACFAEILKEHSVCCCAAHPGFMDMSVVDRSKDVVWKNPDAIVHILFGKLFPKFLRLFAKTDKEGAQTAVHAAITPDEREIAGKFLADCKVIMQPPSAQVHLFRMKIFEEMKRMVLVEQTEAKPDIPAPAATPEPVATDTASTPTALAASPMPLTAPAIEEPYLTDLSGQVASSDQPTLNPIPVQEPVTPPVVRASEPKPEPAIPSPAPTPAATSETAETEEIVNEGVQTAVHAAINPDEREIAGKVIMQPPSAQVHLFRMKIFEEKKRMVLVEQTEAKPDIPAPAATPEPVATDTVSAAALAASPMPLTAPAIEEPYLTDLSGQVASSDQPTLNPVPVQEPVTPPVVQASEPKPEPVVPSPGPNPAAPYIAPPIILEPTESAPAGRIDATPLMSDTNSSSTTESIKPFCNNFPNKN